MAEKRTVPASDDAHVRFLAEKYVAKTGTPTFGLKRAAPLVGASVRSLYRDIADGKLAVCRVGKGRVLVSALDLAAYVLAHR